MSFVKLSKFYLKYFLYRLTINFIGRPIGKLISKIPEKLKKSIIFYRCENIKDTKALEIYKNGFAKIEIKDIETLNSLKSVRDVIYEKIKDGEIKFISKFNEEKSFMKIITKYADKKNLFLIANDKNILRIVKEYFGFYPTVRSIDVWANFPTDKDQISTQFFHRDPDDAILLKLFLPLNKITTENGPFQYIKYSHSKIYKEENSEFLRKRAGSKSKKIEKNLITKLQNQIFSFTGDLGVGCLADTNGLHRGLKPNSGIRLMIAISYCSPYPNFEKQYL